MQTNVTDEMIARYLSGMATPQEVSAVQDYLSENEERIDDLLAMSAAVEQFAPAKPKRRARPLWPALSAAACVALLIGVGIAFWHSNMSGMGVGIETAPAYAEQDTMVALVMEDSL